MNTITRLIDHITGKTTKARCEALQAQISAQKDEFTATLAKHWGEITHLQSDQAKTTEALNLILERIVQAEKDLTTHWEAFKQAEKERIALSEITSYNQNTHEKRLDGHDGSLSDMGLVQAEHLTRIHDLEATTHWHSQFPKDAWKRSAADRSHMARKRDMEGVAETPIEPIKEKTPDLPPICEAIHKEQSILPSMQQIANLGTICPLPEAPADHVAKTCDNCGQQPKPFRPVDIQIGSH